MPLVLTRGISLFSHRTVEDALTALIVMAMSVLVIVISWALKSFLWFYPAFLTSIWTWLYVVSGLLVRTARKLDFVLAFSNKLTDLEHKPLQSVGIVATALCTLLYWSISLLSM
jgi:hypothetical protein